VSGWRGRVERVERWFVAVESMPHGFSIDPYWPAAVVVAIAVVSWVLLRWAYRTHALPGRTRVLSRFLRSLVLVLLVLCLLRPSAVLRRVLKEKGQVLVLVDTSASMAIADEPGGRTRAQSLQRAFADAGGSYDRLRSLYQVKQYEFAEELSGVKEFGFSARGSRTALGDALGEVLRGRLPSRLVGVIVATDGASNTGASPEDVAQAYRKLKVPLHVVACGRERVGRESRDVVLHSLEVPKAVFVRNVAAITAGVTLLNVARQPVVVRLLVDDEEVERRRIVTRSDQEVVSVRFRYVPTSAGYRKVTVEAVPLPDERATGNNRASAYLNVLSGRLSVLYVEGAVRWEFKFVRRALEEAREVDLSARVALAPTGQTPSPVLRSDERWDGFDVVILGDLPRGRIATGQLEGLAKAVTGGTGLICLAGYQTYGSAFFNTPLAPLFPFYLEPFTRQREGAYRARPSQRTLGHPAVMLSKVAADNARLWTSLPELVGGVEAGRLKPAATVLLEDGAGEPVLIVQPYGRGRVAALLADTTWRWAVAGSSERELHRRFWRQLVLWVAGREDLKKENLWIELAQPRYLPQEPVSPAFHLEDVSGEAISGATVVATVTGAGDANPRKLRLYRTGDHWESLLTPRGEGDYLIQARAYRGDPDSPEAELIDEASARFLVERTKVELADPLAHLGLLSQIAKMSGGTFRRADGLTSLFDTLSDEHRDVELEQVSRQDLWNRPLLLLLVVGLLSADWVLRKRSGLV